MAEPAEPSRRRRPVGPTVDYALVGLLTLAFVAILLIFFRDQVATILAWITRLIG